MEGDVRHHRFFAVVGGFALVLFGMGAGGAAWVLLSDTAYFALLGTSDRRMAYPAVFALIMAFGAAGMTWQLVRSSRAGFVYCGRTDVVVRAATPRLYRVWYTVHLFIICFLLASMAIFVRLALAG